MDSCKISTQTCILNQQLQKLMEVSLAKVHECAWLSVMVVPMSLTYTFVTFT